MYIFFEKNLHLEACSRKRAHNGARHRAGTLMMRAGAQPLPPLSPNFLHRDKPIYGKVNNHTDGKFHTHGDGSSPSNP